MQEQLMQARAERWSMIRDILETCTDGKVDIDLVADIVREALETVDAGVPASAMRSLDAEERSAMCAFTTLQTAIGNLSWYLSQQMKPGRARGRFEELPDKVRRLVDEALMIRLQATPKLEVADMLAQASKWAFVIWSPGEQLAMFELLAKAAEGKYISKELQERARGFLTRYAKSMPMGRKYANVATDRTDA